MHDISGVYQSQPNAPGNRRDDMAIRNVEFRALNLSFIGLNGAFKLFDGGALRVELLPGDRIFGNQRLVSREIDFRVLKRRLISRQLALEPHQLGLKRARIDFGERVALADHVALLIEDLHQFAVNAALHGHSIQRNYGAQAAVEHSNVALASFNRYYRRNASASPATTFARRRAGLCRWRALSPKIVAAGAQECQQQQPGPQSPWWTWRASAGAVGRSWRQLFDRMCR